MSKEEQIDVIIDLLTEFDEMGFVPTTTVPDPDAYAIEWKNKLIDALKGYRKQSEGEWLSAYDFAVKIGVTDEERLATAKGDKWWKFCSRCDQQVKWHHNYCPNCGAKMKGGAE